MRKYYAPLISMFFFIMEINLPVGKHFAKKKWDYSVKSVATTIGKNLFSRFPLCYTLECGIYCQGAAAYREAGTSEISTLRSRSYG